MKKLSIAIPTLNRVKLLEFTLENFIPQIMPFANEVELIIVNNNSDDNTSTIMKAYAEGYRFIHFYDCNDRLPLGEQFKRTVNLSNGEFVILWGDDDIPAPFLITYLLNLITEIDCNLYYFNRLVGYEDNISIKSLTVYDKYFSAIRTVYNNSSSFISDNFWGATFMSSVMFKRSVWEKGLDFDTSKHYGFEFMGILYYGNKDQIIIRENFPLCIQRKVAFRAWGSDWPIYALLGLPNMSHDLEKEGLYENGLEIWRSRYNKFSLFCYILMSAATDKKKFKPYCSDFARYQKGWLRKILVYGIVYLFPGWLYNLSRNILFKLKK